MNVHMNCSARVETVGTDSKLHGNDIAGHVAAAYGLPGVSAENVHGQEGVATSIPVKNDKP